MQSIFKTWLTIAAVIFLPMHVAAEEQVMVDVSDAHVQYAIVNGEPALRIVVDVLEGLDSETMDGFATHVCHEAAPQILPQFDETSTVQRPTLIEIDVRVPRSYGIIKLNTGQVRQFDIVDGTCLPRWEAE